MNLAFSNLQFRRRQLDGPDGLTAPRSLLHAPCFHKGDASQSQTSSQTGAQDQGVAISGATSGSVISATGSNSKVFNLSFGASPAQSDKKPQPWFNKNSDNASGRPGNSNISAAPVVNNTEAGGISVIGSTVTLTDAGAVAAALDTVTKLTDKQAEKDKQAMDAIASLSETKAQDATTQKTQLTYAAVAAIVALGGLWAITRKAS